MKLGIAIVAGATILSGCVEEPTPKDVGNATEILENEQGALAVKERQLSIEEAAEEATKLIEADSKSEIENLDSIEQNNSSSESN